MDRVFNDELGVMYVGFFWLYEIFFGWVVDFGIIFEVVFEKCKEGSELFFSDGWNGWLEDVN